MRYDDFKDASLKYLPLNRKERFYTATVLPALLFHGGLRNLYRFFGLLSGFPAEINESATGDAFLFYTEYNLKQSAGDRNVGRNIVAESNDTPDLLILTLRPRQLLVAVEGKMFSRALQAEMDQQMSRQRRIVLSPLATALGVGESDVFHVALVPSGLGLANTRAYQTLNWEVLLDTAIFQSLIHLWHEAGGAVRCSAVHNGLGTEFCLGSHGVPIHLSEVAEPAPAHKTGGRFAWRNSPRPRQPTGKLRFAVPDGQSGPLPSGWMEDGQQRLEDMLRQIVHELPAQIKRWQVTLSDRECEHRQWDKVHAHRSAKAHMDAEEKAWEKSILDSVQNWEQAERIRAYLAEVRRRVDSGEQRIRDQAMYENWQAWANYLAIKFDPLMRSIPRPGEDTRPLNVPISELDLTSDCRHGKGNKQRIVPLSVEARRVLADYLECRPPTDVQAVFIGERGALTDDGVRAICSRYATISGVKFSPHTMRHTFAHRFLEATNNDIVALAQLLGHESLNTTSIYTKRSQDDLQRRMDDLRYE